MVTCLVSAAFFLSLGAGFSALRKWGDYRRRQTEYDLERERAAAFKEGQHEELIMFLQSHPPAEYDGFFAKQSEEARTAGFTPRSLGDIDLDGFVGTRPRETYQAPGEVWVGLAALILATAASILDLWLT